MKVKFKICLFLCVCFFSGINCFAVTKDSLFKFYPNSMDALIVDSLYVNASSGLRLRSSPSLSARKLCSVPFRSPLKIVSVGSAATIDEISSWWVEVYVPGYLQKDAGTEYAWVFGGYLSREMPAVNASGWSASDLEAYLCSQNWDDTQGSVLWFSPGRFSYGKPETDMCIYGSWRATSSSSIRFHTEGAGNEYEEDYYWTMNIYIKEDGGFSFTTDSGDRGHCIPCYAWYVNENSRDIYTVYYGKTCINKICEQRNDYYRERKLVGELISLGVHVGDGYGYEYISDYNKYWNPIVRKHAEKAGTVYPDSSVGTKLSADTWKESGFTYLEMPYLLNSYSSSYTLLVTGHCYAFAESYAEEAKPGMKFICTGQELCTSIKDGIVHHTNIGNLCKENGDVILYDCKIDSSCTTNVFSKVVYENGTTNYFASLTCIESDRYKYSNFKSYEEFLGEVNFLLKIDSFHSKKNYKAYMISGNGNIIEEYDNLPNGKLQMRRPLNMKKPVNLLFSSVFRGGNGGGYIGTEVYCRCGDSFELLCEFGYVSCDAGLDGTSYYFFGEDYLCTYVYQTNEQGKVDENETCYYRQSSSNPNSFGFEKSFNGEHPYKKSPAMKKGLYCNPQYNMNLRSSASSSSTKIDAVFAGTLLRVLEVGRQDTIDGITSNWVKVELVNGQVSYDNGYEELSGWLFGGYLI